MCYSHVLCTGIVVTDVMRSAVVGKFAHPLYKYLTTNAPNPNNVTRITLNYEKFLVDANGKVKFLLLTKHLSLSSLGSVCMHL